ncbi:MAG: hypothetical protein OEV00_15755 [Acidobacteriota bacterium]|nr:hypothetical protein [Acidobacteriota bacterium]MDH3786767.1 hypothetical protein [Acidobacteriota bacterium]
MPTTNTDVYLSQVNVTRAALVKLDGTAIGDLTLEYEDTLTMKPGDSSEGNTVALYGIYILNTPNYLDSENEIISTALVGSWSGSTASVNIGVLTLAPQTDGTVLITDNDAIDPNQPNQPAEVEYWYAAAALITDANGAESYLFADPELMAKKQRTGGGRTMAARKATRRPPEADA